MGIKQVNVIRPFAKTVQTKEYIYYIGTIDSSNCEFDTIFTIRERADPKDVNTIKQGKYQLGDKFRLEKIN